MPIRDHTEGSIIKSILRMGLPSVLGFLSGNIYDLVNMFWLARLGASQVAAVTIFSTFYWVMSSSNQIVGTGSVSVISRRYGEKDYDQAEAAIKETVLLKLVLGIIFGALGYMMAELGMKLLGGQNEVIGLGVQYGKILCFGMALSMSSYTVYTSLRGVGDPNKAMIIMIGGAALNMVLDPLLIFGWLGFPKMGIRGAAIASVIGYSSTFIAGMVIFYGGFTNVRLHLKGKAPMRLSRMWQMLKIGIPSGINSISFALSRSVIMALVAVFGTNVIAIYGVGNRVAGLGVTIVVGMGLGLSALIGHNLGANKLERAWKTSNQSITLVAGVMAILGIASAVFATTIIRIFFQDPTVLSLGVTFLRIQALAFPLFGIIIMIEHIFAGAGDTMPPMVVGIFTAWVLEIPLILFMTKVMHLNQNGVWWAIVMANFIGTVIIWKWFRLGKWIHKKV
jgi:putative MATE family efflux protein